MAEEVYTAPAGAVEMPTINNRQSSYLFKVEGMHCGHCTGTVERALSDVPGVSEVSVDLDSKLARVTGSTSAEKLLAAIEATGKQAEVVPETVLKIEDMMCDHCTSTVDKALRAIAGVIDVTVDLESKTATVHGAAEVSALLDASAAVGHVAEHQAPPRVQ